MSDETFQMELERWKKCQRKLSDDTNEGHPISLSPAWFITTIVFSL